MDSIAEHKKALKLTALCAATYLCVITAANKMTRNKKKLTPEQKAAKKKRREEYMTVFMNGKQKRVKRPPTIDGTDD